MKDTGHGHMRQGVNCRRILHVLPGVETLNSTPSVTLNVLYGRLSAHEGLSARGQVDEMKLWEGMITTRRPLSVLVPSESTILSSSIVRACENRAEGVAAILRMEV